MIELKRGVRSVNEEGLRSNASKRQKADLSMSSKERKEKLSEQIAALQQLVSPYGKTDTASVLSEAMDYIKFLHEQVKVQHGLERSISIQYTSYKNRGTRATQLKKQRPVSCTNLIYRWFGSQQWC